MGKIQYLCTWILVQATRTPRYIPEFEWCDHSWTYNVVRAFEWLFGRRFGIRRETLTTWVDGVTTRKFYTWEAAIAHHEGMLRKYLKRLASVRVHIEVIEMATPFMRIPVGYSFAIAQDNAGENDRGDTGSVNQDITVTGSNPILCSFTYGKTNSGGYATAVSYASAPLTQDRQENSTVTWFQTSWYKPACATGLNTMAVTFSAAQAGRCSYALSYSGANTLDNSAQGGSATSPLTLTVNILTDQSWLIGSFADDSGTTPTANTHFTTRASSDPLVLKSIGGDSAAAFGVGNTTQAANGGTDIQGITMAINPFGAISPWLVDVEAPLIAQLVIF